MCTTFFSVVMLSPTTTSIRNWCILCFFLTVLKNIKKNFKELKETTVGKVILIGLLSQLISLFSSPNIYESLSGFKDFIINILSCDLLIVYSYLSVKRKKQICFLYKVLFVCLVILTIFALFNFLSGSSFFLNYATKENIHQSSELLGDRYIISDRFRVQAMFANPFDYGYICLVFLYIELYAYVYKIQKRNYTYIAFLCCLFGIVTCGCRTVLFCFFIGVICLLFLFFSKNYKKFSYTILFVIFSLILYNTFPFLHDKIDLMFTAISDSEGDVVGGSNLNLRHQQIEAVFFHIKDDLLFGRGVGYFGKDLGFNKGIDNLKDIRLMGLEGVYMSYLLERGFVGLFLWISYYIVILRYFYKRRFKDRYTSAIGITIIVVYISFGCMTGQLLSLYPTLLSLGLLLKICDSNIINKKRYFSKNKSANRKSFGIIKY